MPERLDVTGERYGRLVALEFVGVGSSRKTIWRFRCDCGVVIERKLAHVRKGDTRSCGCYRRDCDLHSDGSGNRLPAGEASFNGLYGNYRSAARDRGFSWSLDRETFRALTQQPCHYCGAAPSQSHLTHADCNGAYIYNGIDRIDNAQGYHPDNVLPCCYICNRAKHVLPQAEFAAWVARVYHHWIEPHEQQQIPRPPDYY